MGWNGSGGGSTPVKPRVKYPPSEASFAKQSGYRGAKKPSPVRGVIAGLVVVAVVCVAYFAFFSGNEKVPEKVEKKPTKIKEVKPAPASKAAVEPVKKTEEKVARTKEPDTNIVWVSKMRYIKKMANGDSVMVFVDNPDEPKPVPIFEVGLNNFLTNFTTPGEDVPETPMEVSNEEVMQALMEKIEIKDDDTEEVKFQKEAVMVLREELRKYIKDGSTVADFIRDVQRRQQMEAEHVREARGMIMEALAKDDPAQARELYDAINKHMNEKGLPKVRIARKFLKMMEVEE